MELVRNECGVGVIVHYNCQSKTLVSLFLSPASLLRAVGTEGGWLWFSTV